MTHIMYERGVNCLVELHFYGLGNMTHIMYERGVNCLVELHFYGLGNMTHIMYERGVNCLGASFLWTGKHDSYYV